MSVANPVLRRTFERLAAFEPLQPHELARFEALVDQVVYDIRKARGDSDGEGCGRQRASLLQRLTKLGELDSTA